MTDHSDRPNKVPWPPIILVTAIIAGFALRWAMPLGTLPGWTSPFGILLIIGAIGIDLAAMRTMSQAKTTILPHKASDALVTDGVFAFSRNPIYVANVMIITGLGLWSSNTWLLITAALAAIAMQKLAIEREEAHLLARFGDAYAEYMQSTRRWI